MEQVQQHQHLHQQLNHQYETQHQLGQNPNSLQTQQHTRQERLQQQSQHLLKKPTSNEDYYKENLILKKRNVVIFGDNLPKGIKTRL